MSGIDFLFKAVLLLGCVIVISMIISMLAEFFGWEKGDRD